MTIDERIRRLSPDVDDEVARDFAGLREALRQTTYAAATIQPAYSLAFRLVRILFENAKLGPPTKGRDAENLFAWIKIAFENGALPEEICSYLQNPRILSNKSHHAGEQLQHAVDDAEIVVLQLLRFCQWLYCESDSGPHLKSIFLDGYTLGPQLVDQIAEMQAKLAHLTKALRVEGDVQQWDDRAFREHLATYAQNMLADRRLRQLADCDLQLSARTGGDQTSLDEAWNRHERLIVAGSPGSGKSIFMLRKFQQLAKSLQQTFFLGDETVPLVTPVYAELGLLSEYATVAHLVLDMLGMQPGQDARATLADVLARTSLVVALDGFNELPEESRQQCAKQLVALEHSLAASGKGARLKIAITTRPYGFHNYFEKEGYAYVEVLPLTPVEIRASIERHLGLQAVDGPDPFDSLGPKLRHLVSNPQNLAYALEWLRDRMQTAGGLGQALRSRGALLDYCASKRLARLDYSAGEIAPGVLRRIAYSAEDGRVHFQPGQILKIIEEELAATHPGEAPQGLLNKLLAAELLVSSDRLVRFPHHSIQQYYAACEMKSRWEADRTQLAGYTTNVLWHEPLVIMAGLVEDGKLPQLLERIRPDAQLYAYVIANINQPQLERELLKTTVSTFSRQVKSWAHGLMVWLAVLGSGWFFSLPLLGLLIAVNARYLNGPLTFAVAAAYIFALPVGLIRWYERRFRQRADTLRNKELPRLITILRYLDAAGAMRQLKEELSESLGALHFVRPAYAGDAPPWAGSSLSEHLLDIVYPERKRLAYAADDPRVKFVNEAIQTVERAINAFDSYMTEDEMLAQIADPLAFASLDVELLDTRHVGRLCELAAAHDEPRTATAAMLKLAEVYARLPEHRDSVGELLRDLALDPLRSGGRRKQARLLCRQLGIPVESHAGLAGIGGSKRLWVIVGCVAAVIVVAMIVSRIVAL
jgi:hypothetical protein